MLNKKINTDIFFQLKRDVINKYPNHSTYYVMAFRDWGKSTGTLNSILQEYESTGKRATWIFRLVDTRKTAGTTMLDRKGLEEWKLKGYRATKKGVIDKNGEIAIYFVAINDSDRNKVSGNYDVWLVVFDEFTSKPEPHELTKFQTILGTTARLEDVKILFLGNHISADNIYLNEELKNWKGKKADLLKDGEYVINDDVVVIAKSMTEDFKEIYTTKSVSKFSQRFGLDSWTQGSAFLMDDTQHVIEDHKHGEFYIGSIFEGNEFIIWYLNKGKKGRYYMTRTKDENKRNSYSKKTYALSGKDGMDSGYIYSQQVAVMIRRFMEQGQLKFDSVQTYNTMVKMVKLIDYK